MYIQEYTKPNSLINIHTFVLLQIYSCINFASVCIYMHAYILTNPHTYKETNGVFFLKKVY